MKLLDRGDYRTYGLLAIAISLLVLVGGLGLTAIDDSKHKVTVHSGYTIYDARDDSLPPNPEKTDGKYYYVEGYWDKPQKTLNDVYYLAEVLSGQETETQPDSDIEVDPVKTTKVHFTVYKKRWRYVSETSRKIDRIPLENVGVFIHKKGSNTIFRHALTNTEGVAVFTVPLGKYDFHVITSGYEKENTKVQVWDEEGHIYYKKVVLIKEIEYLDGSVEDVTETLSGSPEWYYGQDTEDETEEPLSDEETDLLESDREIVVDEGEDETTVVEWEPPWEEGGGDEQLEGTYDENVGLTTGENLRYIAVGVIGATGLLMLIFAQFFMTGRRV